MLNRLIEFSIKNKLIVILFTIGLVLYGIFNLRKIPIDAVPDITDNQVQIITVSPSLGAPDVERFITFPLEQINYNIQGIKEMRSFSRFGLSVITIVFEDDVDLYWGRQQVAERLQQVSEDIPASLGVPQMAPISTGLGEIYQYVIRPKKGYEHRFNSMELRTLQDWIVRRQLMGTPGVADIASFGGELKQYEVAVNPSLLKSMGVTIGEVFSALEKNNQNTGGAYIEKGPGALFIRTEGLLNKIADIENVVVKNLPGGAPLLVKNVATVQYGNAIRYGALTYNGEREVAGGVVMMMKGGNANEVIKVVKERIEKVQKSLPEGVKIEPFLDRTKMVNNAIGTVTKNLVEGALIVIFILVLFLGNFRAGLIVASVIPLAMLFAIIMMNIFGVSGNLMSLGALDFGLIVDGAVIIVEGVLHKFHYNKKSGTAAVSQTEIDSEVAASAGTMMNSAVFGQIIILIVYLPILALQGIEGKMFKPMAETVIFALIGAFILSFTYVPMMSALVLKKKTVLRPNFSDRMSRYLETIYNRSLHAALKVSNWVFAAVGLLFFAALFLLSRLGGEFIPSLPEGDFAVDIRVLPGSNLKTSTDAVMQVQKVLLDKFPEVEKVVGKTGSSEIPTDPMPIEASDVMVILKPKKEWVSAKTYDDLAEKMGAELEKNLIGITFSFQYPVAMRFNELMTGARQDVVCKIYGENLDTLRVYSEKLGRICHAVPGAQNIYVEPISGLPQIVINYNREALAQYGLTVETVNDIVSTAFAGRSTGSIFEDERKFDLVVRLSGEKRKNVEDVNNLLINTSSGTEIPLSSVATVELKESINQIQRENAMRRIIVGFNVRNRDVQSTVHDLQAAVEKNFKLPTGYTISYGGTFENLVHAKDRLGIAVPLSLALIFMMLFFAFRSLKYAFLIFTAIPLSAIGGILALWLRGMNFSISAGVGFIALFGVAVLNGIVLIAEFNRQKALHLNLNNAVKIAGRHRLRPVLMTTLVASLGFLPMALSQGEGAEVQRPLATVVIGGLLIATFLTLFLLPMMYIWFENHFPERKKASKTADLNKSTELLL